MVRTFKIYSLSPFQMYHIAMVTIVIAIIVLESFAQGFGSKFSDNYNMLIHLFNKRIIIFLSTMLSYFISDLSLRFRMQLSLVF